MDIYVLCEMYDGSNKNISSYYYSFDRMTQLRNFT